MRFEKTMQEQSAGNTNHTVTEKKSESELVNHFAFCLLSEINFPMSLAAVQL